MDTQRGRMVRSSFKTITVGWRVWLAVLDMEKGLWRARAENGDGRFLVCSVPSEHGPKEAEQAIDNLIGWDLRETIPLTS